MADVVVVGAGISGAATAYYLARDGLDVVLLDRFGPAAMASGWTLAGVRQSGRHPAELPLARAAVDIWARLAEELDAPTHYRRGGNLRLARNAAEAEVIAALVRDQAATGLDITLLPTTADVRTAAPAVSERVVCASLCGSDGSADPHATVAAFVAAAERLGVVTRFGERVLEITRAEGRVTGVLTGQGHIPAAQVVVAAGIFGNELLKPLGLEIPLQVPMVTVLRSAPMDPVLTQVIGVANADCAGRQEVNGRFRVTSGVMPWHGQMQERTGEAGLRPQVHPTAAGMGDVVRLFADVIPAFAEARIEESWAGLLDMTPDALPVIDAIPGAEGAHLAMGFSGHGFCLGPITGRIMAARVQGKPIDLDLAPFAIDRFQSRRYAGEAPTLHG